jgi:hypothetical protein
MHKALDGGLGVKILSSFNINSYSAMKRDLSVSRVTTVLLLHFKTLRMTNTWDGELGVGITGIVEHSVCCIPKDSDGMLV